MSVNIEETMNNDIFLFKTIFKKYYCLAYPLYYYYMTYCINNCFYRAVPLRIKGKLNYNKSFDIILAIFKKKPKGHVNALFLSRYRKIEDSRNVDYLFDNIIDYFSKKNIKMHLLTNGFSSINYDDERLSISNTMDYISLPIIIKSCIIAIIIKIEYLVICLKQKKIHTHHPFFSIISLYLIILEDLSLQCSLKKHNPKVIISNDDMKRLKPIRYQGNFIVLQSATIAKIKEVFISKYYGLFRHNFFNKSDLFCVHNAHDQNILVKYPSDTKKIIITGQPRFSNVQNIPSSKNEILNKYEIDDNIKIYLWVTQTHALSQYENDWNIDLISNAFKCLSNSLLIIKLHPDEKQSDTIYENIDIANKLIIGGSANLYELLYISDVVITKNSTAGNEAALFYKPIIILDPLDNELTLYEEEKIAYDVQNSCNFHLVNDLIETQEEKNKIRCRMKTFNMKYLSSSNLSAQKIYGIVKEFI